MTSTSFDSIPSLPAQPSLPLTQNTHSESLHQPSPRIIEEKELVSSQQRNKRQPRNAPHMNPAKDEEENIIQSMLMLMHIRTSALKCIFKRTIYTVVSLTLAHSAPLVHVDYSALLSCDWPRFHRVRDDPHCCWDSRKSFLGR